MRKFSLICIILFLSAFFIAKSSYSFQNEPTGYSGNEWGIDLDTYLKSDKKQLKMREKIYYVAIINKVEVDVGYEFFEDRLYGVLINFPADKRDNIIDYIVSLHGNPTMKKGDELYWIGKKTKIVIKRKDAEYVSIELERKYLNEKSKNKD
jgi:hypothetical protein